MTAPHTLRFPLKLILLVITLSGCEKSVDTSNPASPPPAAVQMAAPQIAAGPALVESHERGVFFNRSALTAGAATAGAQSRPSRDALERIQIIDPSGFGAPMPAMSVLMPRGWTQRGGMDWNRNVECAGNTHTANWQASSPDGLHQVSTLPKFTWQVESAPGGVIPLNPCPAAPMRNVREFLEFLARNSRPAPTVLDFRERMDLASALQSAAAGQPGTGAQLRFEAGELLIGYTLQGLPMREAMVVATTFSDLQGSVVAWSDHGVALRAPDGQLDFDLLETLRASLSYERAWGEQMMAWTRSHVEAVNQRQIDSIQEWHNRRMAEINLAGMTARHQIRMDTIAEVGRINNQIVASQAASTDRGHELFKDYIQEVRPWQDPTTGQQVDLSIHYSNAWQLSDGRQFLTNDADFDPNRDLGISGHRLQ